MQQFQIALNQVGEPFLFILKERNIIIDSIQRISFIVKKDLQNNAFGVCGICLESWDNLIVYQRKTIALTNCHHMFCLEELLQAVNNNGKCPLCRKEVFQYFTLCAKMNSQGEIEGEEGQSIILQIKSIKRFIMNYFTESVCSVQNCQRKAIIQCNFCFTPSSHLCKNHSITVVGKYIDENYQRSIFYCQCPINMSDTTLLNNKSFLTLSLELLCQQQFVFLIWIQLIKFFITLELDTQSLLGPSKKQQVYAGEQCVSRDHTCLNNTTHKRHTPCQYRTFQLTYSVSLHSPYLQCYSKFTSNLSTQSLSYFLSCSVLTFLFKLNLNEKFSAILYHTILTCFT
ncbi:hypothetical protein ABPG74_005765 [Tetrahymena malaccensis]